MRDKDGAAHPDEKAIQEIKASTMTAMLIFSARVHFYEMFDEDAKTASKELDLTLTTRDRSVEDRRNAHPCAACPTTARRPISAAYPERLTRWLSAEQTEDPALAKGWFSRRSSASSPPAR
jgi:DNA mismatch repair protein MutS